MTFAPTWTAIEFSDALAAADLVVARSGGSVFEIAAQGLPSILVPYPHAAADHQSENARWMADAGAAIVIADDQLSGPDTGSRGRLSARGRAADGGDGATRHARSPARTPRATSRRSCCGRHGR